MVHKAILCVLDGFGLTPEREGNAISMAYTPYLDKIFASSTWSKLITHGSAIGLPEGQMGNSEVGHMTISAGRTIKQDLLLIEDFFDNQMETSGLLKELTACSSATHSHLIIMISDGGVHSHITHLLRFISYLSKHNCKLWLHLITDGRDVDPQSAQKYLDQVQQAIALFPEIKIATLSGRYYAMDRDNRQERTNLYLDAILGKSPSASIGNLVKQNYQSGITDEFFMPVKFGQYNGFNPGDNLLMLNFRSDRVKQIANSIFQTIPLEQFGLTISLIEGINENFSPLITKPTLINTLGEVIANAGLAQLRIAETEKYPHVTYFFNGGREETFKREERILINSPKVATYDLLPQMSAYELTHELCKQITSRKFEFILVNYANADMVGHTGNLPAAIKAIETIDQCLAKLVPLTKEHNYTLFITADHGNAESIIENNHIITSHTKNPVPLIIINYNCARLQDGTLADIAPTVLKVMDLPIPREMKGKSLINV